MTAGRNGCAPAIAVDIGASAIKSTVISPDGVVRAITRAPTPGSASGATTLLVETIRDLLRETAMTLNDIAGIGISLAAFVTAEGEIVATAHLSQDWVGFPLGETLRSELPTNHYFALDAPAPTLGEAHFGAGRGLSDFAYVTVSTGVGAGLFAGGSLYTGGLGWAGGVGHVVVDPNGKRQCTGCGNYGCVETYAALQGVLALAQEAIQRSPESSLAAIPSLDLSPKVIAEAACAGDAGARWVYEQAGHHLGLGLTSLVDIFSPVRIVVGGGIALAGDLLLEPARRVIQRSAYPPVHRTVEVVPAELGDLSGAFGVAAMVFHDIRINTAMES
jgi:glucokinase